MIVYHNYYYRTNLLCFYPQVEQCYCLSTALFASQTSNEVSEKSPGVDRPSLITDWQDALCSPPEELIKSPSSIVSPVITMTISCWCGRRLVNACCLLIMQDHCCIAEIPAPLLCYNSSLWTVASKQEARLSLTHRAIQSLIIQHHAGLSADWCGWQVSPP